MYYLRQAQKRFQTLCINAITKCAPSNSFLGLYDTSKICPIFFCSFSQHNRGYFIIFFYYYYFRECVFFRPAKASAKRARSARNVREGKALHTLFTLALACKRQTYFRSSLLSLRSDDRKYVCCSQAALASSSETQGQSVGSIKCSW